jgi:hypothetical protein
MSLAAKAEINRYADNRRIGLQQHRFSSFDSPTQDIRVRRMTGRVFELRGKLNPA